MIGGNISAVLQVKDEGELNKIGEREHQWGDVTSLKGWLDLSDGTSNHTNFNAKIQEIAFVPQFSAYTLIEQGRKVKGLLFPITEMYHQRIAIQIFSLPYCQNFIHSHSF